MAMHNHPQVLTWSRIGQAYEFCYKSKLSSGIGHGQASTIVNYYY
jgi:hypothetical protein